MNSLIPTIFFSSTLELFTEEISLQTGSRTQLCVGRNESKLYGFQMKFLLLTIREIKKMDHPCLSTGMTLLFALIFDN